MILSILGYDDEHRRLAHKYLPTLENQLTTPDGKPGWLCTFYAQDEEGNPDREVASFVVEDTRIKLNDFLPEGLTPEWTIKLWGRLLIEESGPFELGLTVAGRFDPLRRCIRTHSAGIIQAALSCGSMINLPSTTGKFVVPSFARLFRSFHLLIKDETDTRRFLLRVVVSSIISHFFQL